MSARPVKILVVEDEAQIHKFLKISFQAHGYMVLEARLGEDGLALCADEQPDLVILDLGDSAPAVFESGGLQVDFAQREVSVDGQPVHLSKKEHELLRMLVSHPAQVLTHQQILREAWGEAQQTETDYLRVLVGQLRQKLGDEPTQPCFIVTVQGVGYRLAVQ